MGNKGGSGSSSKEGGGPSRSQSKKQQQSSAVVQPKSEAAVVASKTPKKQLLSDVYKTSNLTDREKEDRIRVLFNKYDTDHSGELDMKEFKLFAKDWYDELFAAKGEQTFAEFWEDVQLEVDMDGNGTISIDEFIQWIK